MKMDKEGFVEYLEKREIPEDVIKKSVIIVEKFEQFVIENSKTESLETATAEDFTAFTAHLLKEGEDTIDNIVALTRYGYHAKNDAVYLAGLELIDGSDVLEVLHKKLGEVVGEKKRDEVFEGIKMPSVGTPSTEKPKITQAVMDRMEMMVKPDDCKRALAGTAHAIPREYYKQEREKYLQARNIDEYLTNKRRDAIAELEKHNKEKTLFFNQEVTDEVLEYVKSRPDVLTGERQGDVIYHTKIPYLTKEYLAETDETLKRYYACHCAWARESIKDESLEVSPTFCYCSGGFTKQPWEVALDQPLEVELVKSVLKGDLECSFKVHLPKEVLKDTKK
jgi:hypothetical protein